MADESAVDVRTARLAVLGTQMSVLLHELRQPLFAMKAFLEIEAQRGNLESASYLRVKDQVEHMERLMLQYSSLGQDSTHLESFDLNGPVGQTAEWMRPRAKQYGVAFRMELSDAALPVLSTPTNAQQITFNLIQNAYEAVREGPGEGDVVLRTAQSGRWVRLEVEDTGGGWTEGVVRDATKPFVTTKADKGGTGLGLYIVETLVQHAKGEFRLIEERRGLRAQVDLPLVA